MKLKSTKIYQEIKMRWGLILIPLAVFFIMWNLYGINNLTTIVTTAMAIAGTGLSWYLLTFNLDFITHYQSVV